MNLIHSVTTCLKKSFTFSGRASRSEFWYFSVFLIIFNYSFMFILASFLNVNLFNPKIEPISIEQEKLIAQKVEQYIETHKKDANIGVVEMYKIMQDVAPMPSLESMYGENYRLFTGLYTLFTVLLLPATVSVSVRRLHDVNRSGWWYWLPLTIIGIIPLFYWYIKRGTQGDNKYGQSPIE